MSPSKFPTGNRLIRFIQSWSRNLMVTAFLLITAGGPSLTTCLGRLDQESTNTRTQDQDAITPGIRWESLGLPTPSPEAPYANPPKLERLLDDAFSIDTRANYAIAGKAEAVVWESGQLILGAGAKLSRPMSCEDWIDIELDLQFPVLADDGQKSELKILFDLEAAPNSYVVLRQKRTEGVVRSEITLFGTPTPDPETRDSNVPQKIQSIQLEHPLPSGNWRVSYCGGLWKVVSPTPSVALIAYLENPTVLIRNFSMTVSTTPMNLKRIVIDAAPKLELGLTKAAELELQQAYAVQDQFASRLAMGPSPETEALVRESLEIQLRLLGQSHPSVISSMSNLAIVLQSLGRGAEAEPLIEEVANYYRRILPDDHPLRAISLINLAHVRKSLGRVVEAEPVLDEALAMLRRLFRDDSHYVAMCLSNLASVRESLGRAKDAEPLLVEALAMQRRLSPGDDPQVATILNNLALVRDSLGRLNEAEPLYAESLAMLRRMVPGDHPQVAYSLSNLASVRNSLGRSAEAEPLLVDALAMLRRLFPGDHSEVAFSLYELASVRLDLGRLSDAEVLFEESLAMYRRLFAGDHPRVALCIGGLAVTRGNSGRLSEAEVLYEESLAMYRRLYPGDHPSIATTLNSLALVRSFQGRTQDAESLLDEALAMSRRLFPGDHPNTARILNSLGLVRKHLDRTEEADQLYQESLAMHQRLSAGDNEGTAEVSNNLAMLRVSQGRPAEAEPYLIESLAMVRRLYPSDHSQVATRVHNLALVQQSLGRMADAEALYAESLAMKRRIYTRDHFNIAEGLFSLGAVQMALEKHNDAYQHLTEAMEMSSRLLEQNALDQSESAQLALQQEYTFLAELISIGVEGGFAPEPIMNQAMSWKGATFTRQRLMRLAQETDDPSIKSTLEQLRTVASQLATLSLAAQLDPGKWDDWQQTIAALDIERNQLERELSAASADYRAARQIARIQATELSKVLPADAVIVDIYRYKRRTETVNEYGVKLSEHAYCAFVARASGSVKLVELGLVDEVDEQVDLWRRGLSQPMDRDADPGLALRKLLWEPLLTELEGVTTILLSPEGATATIPWAALPGSKPNSYLIEDFAFVTLPVPQQLSEMVARDGMIEHDSASLLLVGDVDYGATIEQSPLIADRRDSARNRAVGATRQWAPLTETQTEVATIRDSFERFFPNAQVKILREDGATEDAFCELAPKHQFLHLATHGFFAPASMRSALAPTDRTNVRLPETTVRRPTTYHPGVLSGVVMAGANNEPQPEQDDGILTALELGELDLRTVDCAVLSACSTGIGPVAGGEGLLGLQRAFQIAGARTTVASLWDVDNKLTTQLMIEFYRNMYHRDPNQRAPSRIEALRRAQLSILTNPELLRGGEDELIDRDHPNRLPPRYWAAWVLSGDWR
ncbi:MAG: CHAT domain-containing protein [Planctomycetaceae bacterium]|nr:CHAT domain-containing protein [Planctomycetaceae bacterium]